IKSRLHRGRDRLRARLTRRGLAPASGMGAGLAVETARAAVPPSLIESTIRLAAIRMTGGVVPAAVAGLAQGAVRVMLIEKIRILAASGLMAAVTVGAGVGVLAQPGEGDGPDAGLAVVQEPREEPKPTGVPEANPGGVGEMPVHEVKSGPLAYTVLARGSLESANSTDVISEVEGETTILMIQPEGT